MSVTARNLLFVIALLVLMVGFLLWYIFAKPTLHLPTTATSTAVSATKSVVPAPPAAPLHIIEHGQYYDVDVQYPSATPLLSSASTDANTAAVQILKTFSQNTIATFKADGQFATLTPADAKIQGLDQGRKYALSDGYTTYSGAHTVSYAFNLYEDTLGAHPNTYFRTFTFDTQTGRSLALSDLFTPGMDYVTEISTLSRAVLIRQEGSGADMTSINAGTTKIISRISL